MKYNNEEKAVLKFGEFSSMETSEAIYKADENGEMSLQEYELYADGYPEKFKYASSNTSENLYGKDSEKVWVLKKENKIIATFSYTIPEEDVRKMVDCLK